MYYGNSIIKHHGILGQKWGIRRYQNPDGTWTDAGKKRRSGYYEKPRGPVTKREKKQLRVNKGTVFTDAARKMSKQISDQIFLLNPEGSQYEYEHKIRFMQECKRALNEAKGRKERKIARDIWGEAYMDMYDTQFKLVENAVDKVLGDFGSERIDNCYTQSNRMRQMVRDEFDRVYSDEINPYIDSIGDD